MEEQDLKDLASQLSCPQGETGIDVGNKMNALNEFMTARTLQALVPRPGEIIAEIGPGNGALSKPLLEALGKDGKYIGIEMSETMAEEARKCLEGPACPVDIICSDCLGAEIEAGSLDGIMAVNVLYFIGDLTPFFERLLGWLKPGGRVVIGVRSDTALEKIPFTRFGFNVRSPAEIKQRMEDAGYVSVNSTTYDEGIVTLGEVEAQVDSVIIQGSKPA